MKTNKLYAQPKNNPSSLVIVDQNKKSSKRCCCNCLKGASILKIKNGCARFVDLLDRGCSIALVLGVNLAVFLFLILAAYTLKAFKSANTLEELLSYFNLGFLLKR